MREGQPSSHHGGLRQSSATLSLSYPSESYVNFCVVQLASFAAATSQHSGACKLSIRAAHNVAVSGHACSWFKGTVVQGESTIEGEWSDKGGLSPTPNSLHQQGLCGGPLLPLAHGGEANKLCVITCASICPTAEMGSCGCASKEERLRST